MSLQATDGEPLVRMVQWPSYHQPVLNRVRLDTRFAELLEPLIGRNLKQIINQIHWKAPGSLGDFAWHQDSKSRRPASAFRNLADSYVQTGLALDPHTPESGCLRFIPGSHLRGDLQMGCETHSLGRRDEGRGARGRRPFGGRRDRPAARVRAISRSGAHISSMGPARTGSDHKRRFYINGYVRAEDCDRGEWAFRNGQPVPFGPKPALVHYEELRERPGPHYV